MLKSQTELLFPKLFGTIASRALVVSLTAGLLAKPIEQPRLLAVIAPVVTELLWKVGERTLANWHPPAPLVGSISWTVPVYFGGLEWLWALLRYLLFSVLAIIHWICGISFRFAEWCAKEVFIHRRGLFARSRRIRATATRTRRFRSTECALEAGRLDPGYLLVAGWQAGLAAHYSVCDKGGPADQLSELVGWPDQHSELIA